MGMVSGYNDFMEQRASGATRAIGGILPILVASLLVLVRGSLKPADLVLVLVLVVVGVAVEVVVAVGVLATRIRIGMPQDLGIFY